MNEKTGNVKKQKKLSNCTKMHNKKRKEAVKSKEVRLKENNAVELFAVYNCQQGENKIIKLLKSHPAAENYAIDNCCNYKTGLQVRKVYASRPKD